jgi:GNAT superfamily N-acetyltransferase
MEFKIRSYHSSDLVSLYRICLLTADSGKDASHLFSDPDLVGHFYAGPYGVLEPATCFTLTENGEPIGYIIGTPDSNKFYKTCEREWFPVLRERYSMPQPEDQSLDANIIRRIHEGHKPAEELSNYPAHLHIDLLPAAQGKGMGRKLINVFTNKLKELNVPALHLQVGKKNTGAVQFYAKVGFHIIKEYEYSIAYGMNL